jgi:outer membrane protein OmpA-like peptidoglycan-associated protein
MHRPSPTRRAAGPLLGALLLILCAAPDAHAQFGKLTQKAKQRVDQTTDKAIDQGLDQVDPTKQAPAGEQAPAEAPAAESGAAAEPAAAPAAAGKPAAAPVAAKEWANYDFVPGSKVVFDTDFSEDRVGNFPQRLEFVDGQLEVVELDGQKALKASDLSRFVVPLAAPLPERYTLEIDFISKNGQWNAVEFSGGREPADQDTRVVVGDKGVEVYTGGRQQVNSYYSDARQKQLVGTLVHLRAQGDGGYLKVYANEQRIVNVPNAKVERANALYIRMAGADGGDKPVYITRIRVAESEASIYDALASTGRWATQGILFETGKSELKPESAPTLKEIAAALKAHPDLKVEIQGHTDNVGKPADNLKLSDARAAAVKAALVAQYGASDAQLTTKGYGDTKPAAPNTTAEGRQNNRRVELVKQ